MIEIKETTVYRDGEAYARITDGVAFSQSTIPPAIKGQIRRLAGNDLAFDVVEDPFARSEETVGMSEDSDSKSEETIPTPDVPTPEVKEAVKIKKPKGEIVPPLGDHRYGDKDPVVVAWWFENHPELAAERYKGRFPDEVIDRSYR